MADCVHKFAHQSTESYWYRSGRNCTSYVKIDAYYCEKCLKQTFVYADARAYSGEEYKLPGWTNSVTHHAKHLDANYY